MKSIEVYVLDGYYKRKDNNEQNNIPIVQGCPIELSLMMKMFYICADNGVAIRHMCY